MSDSKLPIRAKSLSTKTVENTTAKSSLTLKNSQSINTLKSTIKKKSNEKQIISSLFTGRRKNAVARVKLVAGNGVFKVNKIDLDNYFPRESHRKNVLKPLAVTKTLGQYDIICTVRGGGHTGQSGAILLGISRALDKENPEYRPMLKEFSLLTRDSRVVERKKYGKRKARRSTQFSKR